MRILTYWLIPAEPARSHFASIISDLAARFDAPVFEPHVTIYSSLLRDENAAQLLERVLAGRGIYRLLISGIDYADEYTKTVFVQFRPDEELTQLSANFRQASTVKNDDKINPHLSLIYKMLPRETKVEIANSLGLPFDEVRFDSAKAVVSPADLKSRADVESWRVVATQRLKE